MTTPDWMPPLPMPSDLFCVKNGMGYSAGQMRDYALAAVEQYRASLGKPLVFAGVDQLREANLAAYRAGAEAMRERALQICESRSSPACCETYDLIRALPLEKQP